MATSTFSTVMICSWYILISAVLINFNKFIMRPDKFPFAVPLTTFHAIATFTTCSSLYLVAPSYFPSASEPGAKKMSVYFLPVALLFIIGVVCSNQAYFYCSVAFLQFMKEGNVALVFMFSCIAGTQICDRMKSFILLWIVVAACVAVTGKMDFSYFGFFIQTTSQLGETTRIVVQEWLLSGQGSFKFDPLTYQLYLGPPTILVLLVLNYFHWDPAIVAALKVSWPYLMGNASVAVILNITISILIKHAGGLAFVLSGIVKDVMIVSTSTYIAGEMLNRQQLFGFILALSGIGMWGLLKTDPSQPIIRVLHRFLYCQEPAETMNLMEETAAKSKYLEKKGSSRV